MPRKKNHSPQSRSVLAALLEQPGVWSYGYELARRTGLKSGTLYPILVRLHDQDFLEDDWRESGEPGRPRRHIYRLTPRGVELAQQVAAQNDIRLGSSAEATP